MEGKRLIEKIRLRNILSFGDKGEEIELQPLNVLIGQNAPGKSNFIDVIKLLRALPQEKGLVNYISRNGGINEWIWKGKKTDESASVDVKINYFDKFVEYSLVITEVLQRTYIQEERIKEEKSKKTVVIADRPSDFETDGKFSDFENSILLRNRKDYGFGDYFENYLPLINGFSQIAAFTDLQTNRNAEIRKPQIPDAPNDFLAEDASNLSLVLNDLEHKGDTKDIIVEHLRTFYPRVKDYSVRILGGTVQLFIREEGLEKPISAMRLSDGTLRYLCLLAILCHPEPPPLICIEEPETGLHPDILPTIGELLIDASKRTQLIVTTHSDILVSALSEVPEAVLVCEADEDGTHLNRLKPDKLKNWLKKYELGDLWLRGEIGGKRW